MTVPTAESRNSGMIAAAHFTYCNGRLSSPCCSGSAASTTYFLDQTPSHHTDLTPVSSSKESLLSILSPTSRDIDVPTCSYNRVLLSFLPDHRRLCGALLHGTWIDSPNHVRTSQGQDHVLSEVLLLMGSSCHNLHISLLTQSISQTRSADGRAGPVCEVYCCQDISTLYWMPVENDIHMHVQIDAICE